MRPASIVLVHKELRELLPLWMVAIAGLTLMGISGIVTPAILFFMPSAILGTLAPIALGAMSIGHEYRHGTMTSLLSLPVSRWRLLGTKAIVLGSLLILLAGVAWGVGARTPWLWLPIACGFCLAPCFTLLTRNELAGMIFAGAVPATFLLAGDLIAGGLTFSPGAGEMAVALRNRIVGIGTAASCMVAVAGAAWRFLSLDVAEGGRRALKLPWNVTRRAGDVARRSTSVYIALLKKELRLQALPLVTAALLVGVAGLLRVSAGVDTRDAVDRTDLALGPLSAVFLAILSGAVASADERRLGTWPSQMLMPVPLWKQWSIKTAVIAGLAFAYGSVLSGADTSTWRFSYAAVLHVHLPALSVIAALLSLYVSSLSQRAVTALLVATGAVVVAGFCSVVAASILRLRIFFTAWIYFRDRLAPGAIGNDVAHVVVIVATVVLFVTPLVAIAWLAMRNHASLDHAWRRVGLQTLGIVLIATASLAGMTIVSAFEDAVARSNRSTSAAAGGR